MGRIHSPQYLLLARLVLLTPLEVAPAGSGGDGAAVPVAGTPATVQPAAGAGWLNGGRLAGWAWWALRAVLLQQRLLSGRSASLRSLLLGLAAPVLAGLAAPVEQRLAALAGGGGSGGGSGGFEPPSPAEQLLAAGALLEAALLETAYGHVEATKALLQRSSAVLGFQSGEWEARCLLSGCCSMHACCLPAGQPGSAATAQQGRGWTLMQASCCTLVAEPAASNPRALSKLSHLLLQS